MGGTDLFLGTADNGLFYSTDDGVSWNGTNLTNTGILTIATASNGAGGEDLFAGTMTAVFVSSNGGASWTATNYGSTGMPNDTVRSLTFYGGDLLGGSDEGVYLSTDNGESWTIANSGLPSAALCLAVFDTSIIAGTSNGVFLTSVNGTGWMPANSGLTNLNVQSLLVHGDSIYAGTSGGGIFLSADSGAAWTSAGSGLTNLHVNGLAFGSAYLYAATSGAGVFRSSAQDILWSQSNSGLGGSTITAIGASDTNVFASTYNNVYLSIDSGATWNIADSGLQSGVRVSCFAFYSTGPGNSNVFAGTYGSGVFLSADTGKSWHEMNRGMSNTTILSLSVNGGTLYAATDRAVWMRPLSDLVAGVKSTAKSTCQADLLLHRITPTRSIRRPQSALLSPRDRMRRSRSMTSWDERLRRSCPKNSRREAISVSGMHRTSQRAYTFIDCRQGRAAKRKNFSC